MQSRKRTTNSAGTYSITRPGPEDEETREDGRKGQSANGGPGRAEGGGSGAALHDQMDGHPSPYVVRGKIRQDHPAITAHVEARSRSGLCKENNQALLNALHPLLLTTPNALSSVKSQIARAVSRPNHRSLKPSPLFISDIAAPKDTCGLLSDAGGTLLEHFRKPGISMKCAERVTPSGGGTGILILVYWLRASAA
ncbi:MAG: hypothetical protein M1830_009021 [Pleopsidium flavum]|nr:MAG: hypothetical protein M1830_009021 [Pleopsidium flavum]